MDVIYQIIAFRMFYPVEALILAILLAFVPYLLIRGLVVRVWHARASEHRHVSAERAADMVDPHSSPGTAGSMSE
jgi:hypothetical protein